VLPIAIGAIVDTVRSTFFYCVFFCPGCELKIFMLTLLQGMRNESPNAFHPTQNKVLCTHADFFRPLRSQEQAAHDFQCSGLPAPPPPKPDPIILPDAESNRMPATQTPWS
ncbi:unnamed protein product, partial [Sphacelaria rigidula]